MRVLLVVVLLVLGIGAGVLVDRLVLLPNNPAIGLNEATVKALEKLGVDRALLEKGGLLDNPPFIAEKKEEPKRSDSSPSKEEVLGYLDGKTLDLSEAEPQDKGAAKTIMKKAGIKSLHIGNSSRINNDPWWTDIQFIYDTGASRYVVIGRIEHQLIADQRAFFGFTKSRVAKQ